MLKKLRLKSLIVLLSLLFIFCIVFIQCGDKKTKSKNTSNENNPKTEEQLQNNIEEKETETKEINFANEIIDENIDIEEEQENIKKENLQMLKDINQCSSCELSELDLSGLNLESANLSDANLSSANLNETNLSYALLENANLSKANLSGANLSGAYLNRTMLKEADFTGADLSGADFIDADITDAVFTDVIVDELTKGLDEIPVENPSKEKQFTKEELIDKLKSTGECIECDLSEVMLKDEYLMDSNLSGVILSKANLDYALMGGTDLTGADLSNASLIKTGLEKTKLVGANLSGANLTNAYLTQADLSGADLSGAILTDTDFTGVKIDEETKGIPEAILKTIKTPSIDESNNDDLKTDIQILRETNICVSCELSNEDLSGENLSEADISSSTMNSTNFSNANLTVANLSNSSLISANFNEANLSDANLRNTDLSKAIFIKANLMGADFTGAYIKDAVFKDTITDENTKGLNNTKETNNDSEKNKKWVGVYKEVNNINHGQLRKIKLNNNNTFILSIGNNKGNKGEIVDKGNGNLILKDQNGQLMNIEVKNNDKFTLHYREFDIKFKKITEKQSDDNIMMKKDTEDDSNENIDPLGLTTTENNSEAGEKNEESNIIENLLNDEESLENDNNSNTDNEWIGKYTANSDGIKRVFEFKSDYTYNLITIDKRIKPIKLSGTITDKGDGKLKLKSSGGSVINIQLNEGKFTYITGNTTWEFVKEEE